ncbi:ABC transporter permease [Emticicia sp. BO119]|uniref:ABC transporter permease n=1 Tax=Emticicia sp. BO119 TaxID=2757768 RepID=UPI0015F01134|nr:ABC transporter permease [Emticicia sp. BO119]MBA4850875.1 ABC transporter permease [Emticicia sp. BO119]
MLRNYLTIAFRNLVRNKVYSFINIVGLAMGITAFLFILEYISLEKSVNNFHKNSADTYRLLNEDIHGITSPDIGPGWALKAKENFPEIKDFCRFESGVSKGVVKKANVNSEPFRESDIGFAEGNFFEFFSFPLISGNAKALNKPNTVFISEKTAKKYFGNNNPVGQILMLDNQFGTSAHKIEGVFADMGDNSDIRYDMVFSLETMKSPGYLNGNEWATLTSLDFQYINTYFLLNKGVDPKAFESKLTDLRKKSGKENDDTRFRLQPLANVHLASSLSDTYQTTGNLKYVYMLGGIAFLILLVAWFNYINLSTANSLKRANEVGVRKVIGATRINLIAQFLGESIVVNLLGFGLSVFFIYSFQSFFNELIGKELSIQTIQFSLVSILGLSLLFIGSILSGALTAFVLSNFNPIETLKGKLGKQLKGVFLRKALVVSQFSISIMLILGTVLIYRQLHFMQNKNLGMNTHQLLVIKGPEVGKDSTYKIRKTAFIDGLSQQSFIKDYCASGSIPSGWYNFTTSGVTQAKSKSGDELKTYSFAIIGDRFLKTYGIDLKAGRNFTSAECNVDWMNNNKILLNERGVQSLGFTSAEKAVNEKVQWDGRTLEIIGVVKNYHHQGVQKAIDPIIFYPQNSSAYFTVRLTPDKVQDKIASLEKLYKANFAGNPYEYFFVDENFNKQYLTEQQYSRIFTTSSIWAIIIACLGLFGLATFTTESRTKEVGIRKVLGAGVLGITALLSKDFLKLVMISILIASPVAYYMMDKWLENFEYKVDISWWIFASSGLGAIGLALITVGYQAIRAALMNPVKSLKTE